MEVVPNSVFRRGKLGVMILLLILCCRAWHGVMMRFCLCCPAHFDMDFFFLAPLMCKNHSAGFCISLERIVLCVGVNLSVQGGAEFRSLLGCHLEPEIHCIYSKQTACLLSSLLVFVGISTLALAVLQQVCWCEYMIFLCDI